MANLLTFSRLVLAGAFAAVVAIFGGGLGAGGFIVLLTLVLAVEATDLLDGPVARRSGAAGKLGGILDPLADSLARLAIYFAMALAGWVTIAVPLVMAGRDIVVAYTRIVQAVAGGATSARFSGKLKAVVQGAGAAALIVLAFLPDRAMNPGSAKLLRALTAGAIIAVTAWSMLDYVRAAWPALRSMARR